MEYPEVYAVDFDGTLNINAKYPELGEPNKRLFDLLIARRAAGDKVILWTCREGERLKSAVKFCNANGLHFDAINDNIQENIEHLKNNSRKVFAHYYIDDKNVVYDQIGITVRPKAGFGKDLKKAIQVERKKRIIAGLAAKGLSPKEIAEESGINQNTVYWYLNTGRAEHEDEICNEVGKPGWNADRHACRTCKYRSKQNGCDYSVKDGRYKDDTMRGCDVADCDKYEME